MAGLSLVGNHQQIQFTNGGRFPSVDGHWPSPAAVLYCPDITLSAGCFFAWSNQHGIRRPIWSFRNSQAGPAKRYTGGFADDFSQSPIFPRPPGFYRVEKPFDCEHLMLHPMLPVCANTSRAIQ